MVFFSELILIAYSTRIDFVTNFCNELCNGPNRTEPNFSESVRFGSVRKSSVRKKFVTKSMQVLYYFSRRSSIWMKIIRTVFIAVRIAFDSKYYMDTISNEYIIFSKQI
jgi:hypothetical protein